MLVLLGLRAGRGWERSFSMGLIVLGVLLACGPSFTFGQNSASNSASNPDRLPVTTTSPEAAKLFEEGLHLRYDYHLERALVKWREAAIKDPNFAQAWTYIVWIGLDPAETKEATERAEVASARVTPGEKLLMRWMVSTNDGHYLDAIAAMNDLMAMYPRDEQLNFEAGLWLQSQGDFEGAIRFTKRALAIDPKFAGALNTLGYDLAYMHEYDEAIPYLKRYIEAEPTDPNPHDSLAEILQKAGRLEESLAEYREALKLDPKFYSSQKAIGDDYALLGDQERARQEYAKALPLALTPQDRLDCQIQYAITYARENDRKRARTELAIVLEQATKLNLNDYQSAIHRYLALLAESPGDASQQLDQAEAVLEKAGHVSGARRNSVLANTLRTRARLASEEGKLDVARAAVSHLQRMLQTNRSNAIERAYHGANGALLAAEAKTGAAIEELSEDSEYPFSESKRANLLASSGNEREAAKIRARLKADYGTALEDWLVVRGLRQ